MENESELTAIRESLKRLGRICCLIGDSKGNHIKLGGNSLPIPITQREIQDLKMIVLVNRFRH